MTFKTSGMFHCINCFLPSGKQKFDHVGKNLLKISWCPKSAVYDIFHICLFIKSIPTERPNLVQPTLNKIDVEALKRDLKKFEEHYLWESQEHGLSGSRMLKNVWSYLLTGSSLQTFWKGVPKCIGQQMKTSPFRIICKLCVTKKQWRLNRCGCLFIASGAWCMYCELSEHTGLADRHSLHLPYRFFKLGPGTCVF